MTGLQGEDYVSSTKEACNYPQVATVSRAILIQYRHREMMYRKHSGKRLARSILSLYVSAFETRS